METKQIIKKIIFRISIFLIFSILYYSINSYINSLEIKYREPAKLTFQLPFPKDIEQKYDLLYQSHELEPKKIVLTGFFSDWDPDDETFEMKKVSENKWQIVLNLPPGDNQYKYVVHVDPEGDGDPDYYEKYWVYDKNAETNIDDSYGGVNSIYYVPEIKSYSKLIKIIFISLFVVLILFFLLEPLLHIIVYGKLKFKTKLIINAFILGLITNIIFIGINLTQQREIIKGIIIENINLLHLKIKSHNIQFDNLASQQKEIGNLLNRFFKNSKTRFESEHFSSNQTAISGFALLDKNFNLINYGIRQDAISFIKTRAKNSSKPTVEAYLKELLFKNTIDNYKKLNKPKETFFDKSLETNSDSIEYRKAIFFLRFSQVIRPIIENNQVVGYYCLDLTPQLYGNLLMKTFLYNIFLLPIFLLFYYFLFAIIGTKLTKNIAVLVSWTENIIKGNFKVTHQIRSNDEIQKLSENFNLMRISLGENFDKIKKQNKELKNFKNNLQILVDERTAELKTTMKKLENANKVLENLSVKDALTNIFNRRYFNIIFNKEYKIASRQKYSLSILMLDLDNFKNINDEYGHVVGDNALIMAAKSIQSILNRPSDILARYGGEEFIVLLPQTDLKGSELVAEKIRKAIEKITIINKKKKIKFTISIGLYSKVPDKKTRIEHYVQNADEALYEAKTSGKNKVCIK